MAAGFLLHLLLGPTLRRGEQRRPFPANTAEIVLAGADLARARRVFEVLIVTDPSTTTGPGPRQAGPRQSLAETAIREIREEVGLQVTLGVPLAVTSLPRGRPSQGCLLLVRSAPRALAPWPMRVKWTSFAGDPEVARAPADQP